MSDLRWACGVRTACGVSNGAILSPVFDARFAAERIAVITTGDKRGCCCEDHFKGSRWYRYSAADDRLVSSIAVTPLAVRVPDARLRSLDYLGLRIYTCHHPMATVTPLRKQYIVVVPFSAREARHRSFACGCTTVGERTTEYVIFFGKTSPLRY